MSSNRPAPAAEDWPGGGRFRAWTNFWFAPASPVALHALRVAAGLVFLGWLLTFAGQQEAVFGLDGWFDRTAYQEATRLVEQEKARLVEEARRESRELSNEEAARMAEGLCPPIGWSLLYWCADEPGLLQAVYWGSAVVLLLFTLGLWTRLTAVLTWLIVISFLANPAARFEADYLLVIVAFYLMIGYVLLGLGDGNLSLMERLLGPHDAVLWSRWRGGRGPAKATPSPAANLAVRLLQVHFAFIVVVSALHKLQMEAWWSGVALWYPLHPPLETTARRIVEEAPSRLQTLILLGIATYLVLAWQLTFPLFAWRRKSWARLVLLGGGVIGWIGSLFLFRQPVFGPIYALGCLSYLTPAEWLWIPAKLASRQELLTATIPALPSAKIRARTRV
jgi:hypothetical protein